MDSQDNSSPESQPPDAQPITIQRVLDILTDGEVSENHGMLRWSSNYTFLLSVSHDADSVMCIYKPRSGERPLWDFPDGTLALRERAAFLTSQALGWQIVPPTVIRDGPRGPGSMQFFVDHDPKYTYFEFSESLRPQLARLALFDAIVNNADRKGGHCLVDAQDHLWGIDHGLTFNVAHKLRTVIWDFTGQPIPDVLREDLERLCSETRSPDSAYRQQLERLLLPDEMRAYQRRIDRLLERGTYPTPGPGPNYPWPPV